MNHLKEPEKSITETSWCMYPYQDIDTPTSFASRLLLLLNLYRSNLTFVRSLDNKLLL